MAEKVIHKYEIPASAATPEGVRISMPVGARILSVGIQSDGKVKLWALVDPESEFFLYEVYAVGTGWKLSPKMEGMKCAGRITTVDGLEFHIFINARY